LFAGVGSATIAQPIFSIHSSLKSFRREDFDHSDSVAERVSMSQFGRICDPSLTVGGLGLLTARYVTGYSAAPSCREPLATILRPPSASGC
jgi:hypothetical protein